MNPEEKRVNPVKKLVTIIISFALVAGILFVLSLFKGPLKASSSENFTFAQNFNEIRDVCYVDGLRAAGKYQIIDIPEKEELLALGSDATAEYTIIGITDEAFQGEAQIEEVIIPVTVTYIGENAFDGCSGITKVTYKGTKEEWEKIDIQNGNDCLTNVTVTYE